MKNHKCLENKPHKTVAVVFCQEKGKVKKVIVFSLFLVFLDDFCHKSFRTSNINKRIQVFEKNAI